MNAKTMWNQFIQTKSVDNTHYQAWAFGDDSDALAQLVCAGIKTATASALDVYEYEHEPLPQCGDYSIILNSQGEAQCIIQTTAVSIVPFAQVSALHAYKEGERDRSLASWRTIHEVFFTKELNAIQRTFHPDMMVVCEEFQVVYPLK